ncbi:MAG: response regulator [Candidatus Margulisiibacteriota bacterium]
MAKKILVVDDEPDILRVVEFRLKKEGYTVYVAKDGGEGWKIVQEIKPDLVFLDLRMPILGGSEVCDKIRQDEKLKNIPVIFLSASQTEQVMQKMQGYKANDYMIKPFEPEELLAKVRKYIGE